MIRKVTTEDLPKMFDLAAEFYSSSEFLEGFDIDIFINNWTKFINTGIGIIWILNDFDGCLGAMKYLDVNNGELIATELFWFVSSDKRGDGIKLLKEFEMWAKTEGCKKIIMVHLTDLMPESVASIYKWHGYKPMEIHYVKEL